MSETWRPHVPLFEQVNSMKHKIKLMDGDRKAYYDATFQKLMKEHNKLMELRQQVKTLRNDLRDRKHPDEFITDQALQRQPKERQSMLRFSALQAMELMDNQVSDTMKRLNAIKYKTKLKMKNLNDLEENYTKLLVNASELEDIKARQGKTGQKIRDLENRLDKAFLKQNEALHINTTYENIRNLMKQEAITYNLTIDAMEKEIEKAKDELKQVKTLQSDSLLARNHDLIELRRHEEFITTELKRRELELLNLKQKSQSKNFQVNQSKVVGTMEISFGDHDELSKKSENTATIVDVNKVKLENHENLFQSMKHATGISNLNQMIKRFQTQVNTKSNLEQLKKKCEDGLVHKKREKEDVIRDYLNQKFLIEEKTSKQSQAKGEKELKIQELVNQYKGTLRSLACREILLSKIKIGLEHLAYKCEKKVDRNYEINDIKFYNKLIDKISVEVLLMISELKDYNLPEEKYKLKEEEDEVVLIPSEFSLLIDNMISSYNTRIKINVESPKEGLDSEEIDDDTDQEDRPDIVTRQALKRQSRKILEAKAKKRVNVM